VGANHKRLRWVLMTFLCVVVLDQITKQIIVHTVTYRYHVEEFFYITYERNPGLVGGAFGSWPWVVKIAPVVATVVLIYLYRQIATDSRLQAFAFGLVAGGAIGNIIDRFLRHEVIDFIQFYFYFLPDSWGLPSKRYPAFNIADSAICVGVGLLLFTWFRSGRKEQEQAGTNAPDTV